MLLASLPCRRNWNPAPPTIRAGGYGVAGVALTRLGLKVLQVHFILILVDVLVSAHHHNGKFELKDRQARPL